MGAGVVSASAGEEGEEAGGVESAAKNSSVFALASVDVLDADADADVDASDSGCAESAAAGVSAVSALEDASASVAAVSALSDDASG